MEKITRAVRGRSGEFAALFFTACMAVHLAGCFNDRLKPVGPTWDVDLTFPIASRTFTVADLINKDPGVLRVGAGNQVIYSTSVAATPSTVGNAVTLNPAASTHQVKLGAFNVLPDLTLYSLDLASLPPGQDVPIPDTVVAFPDQFNTAGSFVTGRFKSGNVVLTFKNNLPSQVTISGPVTLSDDNGTVATFTFPPPLNIIAAGGIQFSSVPLFDGQSVDQNLRLSGLQFHIAPHAASTQIPDTLIVAGVAFLNLRAHDATLAYIPAQRLNNNDTTRVGVNDSTKLVQAVMAGGKMHFDFASQIPVAMTLVYNISQMQKTVGGVYVPYIDSVALGALGSGGKDIGLGGTRLRSLNGNLIDSLETVSSLSVPAWPTPVTLHDTDKVQITYTTVSPLMADSAVAVLKPTKINVHSVVPLHWGDVPKKFAGTLNLPAASLGLNAVSTIGFPMDLTIALSAKDPVTGQQATLSLPAPSVLINADASTLVSFDSVAVGQFVSTFTRFSGRLPDSLRVDGFVIVNPIRFYNPTVAGAGAVSARSSVGGTVNVDLPLKFGLAGGIYRDTTAVGLQKDDIKAVNSGTMYIEVLNALPVQVSVTAAVIDSAKSKVLILVPQSGLPVNVVAASVTGTGIVNVPARSSTSVSLNSSEVQLMAPNRNFAYAVTLSTTPGSPTVAFRSTDSVKVKVWSSFSYQVNK